MGLCQICHQNKAQIKRPKTLQSICKTCFYAVFELEIHNTIVSGNGLFKRGDRVGIGASGGKDSTVLAHIMKTLNDRYDYGLDLILLSIDEGISGYRDDSLETVKRNAQQYSLPLHIVSYEELYGGWSMDKVVQTVGQKNNCTFCGVFRRQALDRGCVMLGITHLVTGHNADDIAETVLMNILRGDIARLGRSTIIKSNNDEAIPRSKPFKYTYEKEIVMYAYFKKLDYFSTECIYSPNAYRGYARAFLKDLEAVRPCAIMDIIHSGEAFEAPSSSNLEDDDGPSCGSPPTRSVAKQPKRQQKVVSSVKKKVTTPGECERCGYMSSQTLCKACVLLEGLNRGLPKLGIVSQGQRNRQRNTVSTDAEPVPQIQHMSELVSGMSIKAPTIKDEAINMVNQTSSKHVSSSVNDW